MRSFRVRGSLDRVAAVLVVGCVALLPGQAAAQTSEGTPSRTPWGDPDLQGIWNNATITPLQRPESLGDQAFLTAEEIAAMEQRAAEGFSQANATQELSLIHI